MVLASLLAACGQPGASEQRDLLFVQAAGGVAVIAAGDDEPAFEAPAGVPSHDWSTVVRAVPVAGGTEVSPRTR